MTRKHWKPVALVALVAALFAAALALGGGERLTHLKDEIESFGPWAPVVFILVYILSTAAMIPGAAMTLMAGGVFGSFWGVVYVNIAATIGAGLCFLISRKFARKAVGEWLRENPHFQKLDAMTESHGPAMVAVTRLVPIFPYGVLNYGFGLTGVGFWPYLLLTWVCMIPGTVLYIVGADAAARWLQDGRVPWLLVVSFVVLLAVILFIGVRIRKKWVVPNDERPITNE